MTMKKNMGEKGRKLMDAIKADKKITLIVCIGLLGMLLLLASEFIHLPKKQEAETPSENIQTEYSYAEDLEKRLTNIVSSISGAGKTKVMVTLENGVESVYAADEKQSVERSSVESSASNRIRVRLVRSNVLSESCSETGLGTIATASDFGIRLPQEANSISAQHKESKPVFISVLVFLGLYITTRYRSDKRPARQSIWFDLEEINLPAADKFTFFLLIKPVPTGAFAKINALFQHC